MSKAIKASVAAPVAGEQRNGSIGFPSRGFGLDMWQTFSAAPSPDAITSEVLEKLIEKKGWPEQHARTHLREWRKFYGHAASTEQPAAKKAAAPVKKAEASAKKAAAPAKKSLPIKKAAVEPLTEAVALPKRNFKAPQLSAAAHTVGLEKLLKTQPSSTTARE